MPAWTDIPNSQIDQDSPVTQPLLQALRDNPSSIAEDDPSAPKIKRRHFIGGPQAISQTFTGLGAYSGLTFNLYGQNLSTSSRSLLLEYSTDGGTTWSTPTAFATPAGNALPFLYGHFDFATGIVAAVGRDNMAGTTLYSTSATLAGASLSINAVRFSSVSSAITIVVMIQPNGGTV